jgi:hypothetical protein
MAKAGSPLMSRSREFTNTQLFTCSASSPCGPVDRPHLAPSPDPPSPIWSCAGTAPLRRCPPFAVGSLLDHLEPIRSCHRTRSTSSPPPRKLPSHFASPELLAWLCRRGAPPHPRVTRGQSSPPLSSFFERRGQDWGRSVML